MEAHLSNRHRDTVERIFSHPPSRNIEWREVVSLLETVGTVAREHSGKLKVSLGPETEVLPAPRGTNGWDFATGLGSPDVYNLAQDVVAYMKR